MIFEIDGNSVFSEEDFHKQVKKFFAIRCYGCNCHALYDLLTGMVDRPLQFVWYNSELSKQRLNKNFIWIVRVFDRVIEFDKGVQKKTDDIFSYVLL